MLTKALSRRSLQRRYWLALRAAGERKSKVLSAEGHTETLPPPALPNPQLHSARSWKTASAPGPESNNQRVKGGLRRQAAQVKLLK